MCRNLTFEKHKFALAVLIDGVNLGWQTPPEDIDEHGVTGHHGIIFHPPKPVVLHRGKMIEREKIHKDTLVAWHVSGFTAPDGSYKALHVVFLEHRVVNTRL